METKLKTHKKNTTVNDKMNKAIFLWFSQKEFNMAKFD